MHSEVFLKELIWREFLCKHLLIDWRCGEVYFSEKLLDYELSSNNGNWQWTAGMGVDAAPFFRIFNPMTQLEKFDPNHIYVKRWLGDQYPSRAIEPMVDHKEARERALKSYKSASR